MTKNFIARMTLLSVALGFSATAALAQTADAQSRGDYYRWHDMMWGTGQWGGFGMVLGPIFMILILIGIVGGVLYIFRAFAGPSPQTREDGTSSALAILNERYARGEIDTGEFEERKKQLRS